MKNYLKALSLSALSLFGSPNEVNADSVNKDSVPQETVYTPKSDNKPTAVFDDKKHLSEKELQEMVNAYFAEHGRPDDAAKVQVRENLVEARKEGDIFYTSRLNGKPYSHKALALGTATNDGYITINRYTADGTRVGAESAAEYQKELDSFSRKANITNVVKHESHHALTYLETGDKLYDCTALQYAEIYHTRELSAARETAFNELSTYKKTRDKDDISDDNAFLLEMKEIDFSSPKISKEEAKAVTLAVDNMYQEGKLASYDKNMAFALSMDWNINRQKLEKNGYSQESYNDINNVYNNHTINGQKIDVSEFHKNVDCNAFMTYMVIKNPYNINFDEKDKKEFSEIKHLDVLPEDRGNSSMMLLGANDVVMITSIESNFASQKMSDYDKYIQSGLQYNLGYTQSMQNYLKNCKEVTAHNQDMEMKSSDLKGYLGFEKSYQASFAYEAEEAKKAGKHLSREEALTKMRNEKNNVVCGDILSAYLCGKKDQIDKISPNMQDVIEKTCPSLKLASDNSSAKINFNEFNVFRKEISSRLNDIAPNFEQEMQSYYDKNFGKTEQSEKLLEVEKEPLQQPTMNNFTNIENPHLASLTKQQDSYKAVKNINSDGGSSVLSFKNGKLDGPQIDFEKDGSLKNVSIFENGKERKDIEFKFIKMENGEKRAYGIEIKRQKEGIFLIENDKGKIEKAKVFKSGNEVLSPRIQIEENHPPLQEKNNNMETFKDHLQKDHNRISAMRAKMADNSENRAALLNIDNNNTQKSQGLRFSSPNKSSTNVLQTQISTDNLKKLRDANAMG